MAAEFRIDPSLKIVHSQYRGEVTLADVLSQRELMAAHPEFDPGFALIIDLSEATRIAMDPSDVSAIAHSSTTLNRWSRHVCVAPRPELYGIGRMYQMMGEAFHPNTAVVHSLEEAMQVLEGAPLAGVAHARQHATGRKTYSK